VAYNLVAGPATEPLVAPRKVRAYALPGFFVPSGSGEPTGKPIDAQSNAGRSLNAELRASDHP
jgi:hypothetical protein